MTFLQAQTIAKQANLAVRRETWPSDKWFTFQRALFGVFPSDGRQPVRCTDYNVDDLQATDWTTVPAALVSCPVDPPTPGGGPPSPGGGPPVPGDPGFPDGPP